VLSLVVAGEVTATAIIQGLNPQSTGPIIEIALIKDF